MWSMMVWGFPGGMVVCSVVVWSIVVCGMVVWGFSGGMVVCGLVVWSMAVCSVVVWGVVLSVKVVWGYGGVLSGVRYVDV